MVASFNDNFSVETVPQIAPPSRPFPIRSESFQLTDGAVYHMREGVAAELGGGKAIPYAIPHKDNHTAKLMVLSSTFRKCSLFAGIENGKIENTYCSTIKSACD
jgi:hypothetical protein